MWSGSGSWCVFLVVCRHSRGYGRDRGLGRRAFCHSHRSGRGRVAWLWCVVMVLVMVVVSVLMCDRGLGLCLWCVAMVVVVICCLGRGVACGRGNDYNDWLLLSWFARASLDLFLDFSHTVTFRDARNKNPALGQILNRWNTVL